MQRFAALMQFGNGRLGQPVGRVVARFASRPRMLVSTRTAISRTALRCSARGVWHGHAALDCGDRTVAAPIMMIGARGGD